MKRVDPLRTLANWPLRHSQRALEIRWSLGRLTDFSRVNRTGERRIGGHAMWFASIHPAMGVLWEELS